MQSFQIGQITFTRKGGRQPQNARQTRTHPPTNTQPHDQTDDKKIGDQTLLDYHFSSDR